MKIKKIIAGLLVVSLVASVITITTRANQRDISTEPIATYTFEDSLQNVAGDASNKASAIVTGLSNYTGSIQYNADAVSYTHLPETLCLQAVEARRFGACDRVLFVERSGELRMLARLSTEGAEPKREQV